MKPAPLRPAAVTTRRNFLLGAALLGALTGCGSKDGAAAAGTPSSSTELESPTLTSVAMTLSTSTEADTVSHTDAEWRQLLTPEQYEVLRAGGTETPFSSPLNDEHRDGVFRCAGCALDLFTATTKFDSGTGWPSFWQVKPNAVLEQQDTTLGMVRTEVLCRRCAGHLGHVFDDGPKPTGLRYCMNGVALNFLPS